VWEIGAAGAVVAALLLPSSDPPSLLPEPVVPDGGCVIPVGGILPPCPTPDRTPLGSCVLPVSGFVLPEPEPECPARVPDPRGTTVPLSR
jgi:hypothetical protein